MSDLSTNVPESKKVGVWAEGTHIVAKEYVMPKNSLDSSDDIPTIPDLDDLQDMFEKEISMPPITDHKDIDTVNALTQVSGGITENVEGVEAALEVLRSFVPKVEEEVPDTVWTIDSLLLQLSKELNVDAS